MRYQQFDYIRDRELAERRKSWLFLAALVFAIALIVVAVVVH
jgi:hypothetical protein